MNAVTIPDPLSSFAGGFCVGRILITGVAYALIVAPRAEGDRAPIMWHPKCPDVPGAKSYNDGRANTLAMAEAGSKLAQWALDLRIGGFADWYVPSLDELELCYRHLKPTSEQNSCYARSGINLSADPPAWPYTPEAPVQTANEFFRAGGSEAFEEVAHWTSTQHASGSSLAWGQDFGNGYQGGWDKYGELRARAVRRLAI